MKIAISAESTVDLGKELLAKYDINVIPFTVILGDKVGLDGDIVPDEIFEYVSKTGVLPKTTAINEFQYEEYFKSLLDKGYDAIIHFALSSKISSSWSHADAASKHFKEGVVNIIDSKSLSTGIGLQTIYARKLVDSNKYTCEEIVKKCSERVPHVQASFVLARLDYLYKGGRCSKLSALAAKAFKIRPQILVDDGAMRPGKKYLGSNDKIVVGKYCQDTLAEFNNPDHSVAFVTATKYDDEVYEIGVEALKKAGFKTIYKTVAGSTITSHCGEKTLGILYINDGDEGHD